MEIEYDPEKDRVNWEKHSFPLELGAVVIENRLGQVQDERRDYGEVRLNAFGLVNGRLLVCTYTRRDEAYRLISVRKASWQERRIWLP